MADQPVRFNPVGNMDKDADPRYVRQGNYLDAKNIQKLTEKGGTGGAVIPVKGNEHAFDLGSVTAQNKKYRIHKGKSLAVDVGDKIFDFDRFCKAGFIIGFSITTDQPHNFSIGDYMEFSFTGFHVLEPGLFDATHEVTEVIDQNTFIIGNPLIPVGPIADLEIPCDHIFQFSGMQVSGSGYQLQFWSMNDDYLIANVFASGSVTSLVNAINSSPIGPYVNIDIYADYIDVEINNYDYYDWILRSVGDNFLSVYPIQEAIPRNVEGPLKANGSCDILGDLFITSTSTDLEPQVTGLSVSSVDTGGPLTTVTFTSDHNFQAGEWVGISESAAHWVNGTFLIQSVPSSNQINIVTSVAWGASFNPYSSGQEVITSNPSSIGEIGVATYNQDSDVWTYTGLLRSMDLNFVMEHANDISGRDDIRRKTLYYTDDYNNRRAFYYYGDYQTNGALNFINPDNFYYYDIIDEQSEISSSQISTDIELHSQQAGGNIGAGNKRYFCYLVDFFGNRSAYSYLSNIVSAYSEAETGRAMGDLTGVNTGKMNRIMVSDIDQRMYQYISLGYIDYVGDVVTASTLPEVDITGNTMVINHFGSEPGAVVIDLAEIPISLLKLPKKALNVDVIDNRLVFSNLQEEPKRDIRDWAKTFKHRIKEEWINESNSFTPANEYQNVQTIHDKLGYMIDETYRFGVQVRWRDSGIWSEAAWVDDIKMHFRTNNDGNPFGNNRRVQLGNDILEDYDLNRFIYKDGFPGTPLGHPGSADGGIPSGAPWNLSGTVPREAGASVKIVYPEFFGFDFAYEVEGEPLSNLIDKIKIVRAECIPEVICNGALVLSVGLGSSLSNDNQIVKNQFDNRPDFVGADPVFTTELGSQMPNGHFELPTTLFPVSFYQNKGDLYNAILPAIILSQNDSDPNFDWKNFEGTFHEYPFAAHPPSQAGPRLIDQREGGFAGGMTNISLDSWKMFGFYAETDTDFGTYAWNGPDTPSVPLLNGNWNNYSRVFRERGLYYNPLEYSNVPHSAGFGWGATNNSQPAFYGGPARYQFGIGNYGYPDFEYRGPNPMHNICPLYHYGEDANPDLYNSGGSGNFEGNYKKFFGAHGQPFGTKVMIANNAGASSALAPSEPIFYPSRRLFYPFWVNRRIVSFYSPDVMLGLAAVTASAQLKVFGEFRLNRSHVGDYATANIQQPNVNGISGYTEYWVDGMGNDTVNYDINNVVEIGDGGAAEVYPTARFRKGLSALCNGYVNSGPTVFGSKSKPHEQYNNLWTNPTSPVLQIDGSTNSDNVDGLNGLLPQQKNTDYGVYYGQIFQANSGKHGPTGDTIYIDTGNSFRVDQLGLSGSILGSAYNIDSVNVNQIKVFGGDTFTQGFYLANRKVNPSFKTDGGWNYEHFVQSYNYSGNYHVNGIGQPKSPGFGSGMKFYSQNRVNAQMRADDSDSFIFPKDGTLGDWLNEDEFGFGTDFRYNESYTPKNGVLSYNSINDRLLQQQTDLPSRIDYSEKYDQQTIDDKSQSILPLNFKDIDQTFGEIISHKNVNGELFTLQPRKFQAQYFHATGQLQTDVAEGMNIVIGDGSVLSRDGQSLSAYGTQHKWSVIKGRSPGGKDVIYWFNQESKLIMRFGADGTVVLSDVKGLRSFLENDARWTEGEDSPYVNQGIRSVWDDEYKEAIWTWRGYRASRGMWETPPDQIAITYNVGDTVAYSTYNNYPFEQIPDVYICTQEHSSSVSSPNTPGSSRFWELVSKDDGDYYSNFTLAFNEMTNGFSSFYSHMPKIYFPWKNKFLSAHPTQEQKIYEHRKGEYTTWYTTQVGDERPIELSEDAYIEGIVNYLPESSKKFVATQVISDNAPDRMEFKTLNQESFLNKGEFDDHDDHWRSPIKNDSTQSGDPSGDTKSLMGDFIKVKFFFTKKTYNRLYNFVVKLRERLRIYRS